MPVQCCFRLMLPVHVTSLYINIRASTLKSGMVGHRRAQASWICRIIAPGHGVWNRSSRSYPIVFSLSSVISLPGLFRAWMESFLPLKTCWNRLLTAMNNACVSEGVQIRLERVTPSVSFSFFIIVFSNWWQIAPCLCSGEHRDEVNCYRNLQYLGLFATAFHKNNLQ